MAGDDLETPLGLTTKRKRRSFPIGLSITVLLALCLLTFVGWTLVVKDPLGGEPVVVVKLEPDAAEPSRPAVAVPATAESPAGSQSEAAVVPKPASSGQTVTIIDGSTGKRQEVVIPSTESTEPAPAAPAVDQRMLESTRHGNVPRIALDGTRPSVAYARPAPAKSGTARVAIVVSGFGVSPNALAEGMKKLPPGITFAFQPYGSDLERSVEQARNGGHEVLLQVPMEPFDYPDNDPGPQTLLTSLTPDQNVDRMQWAMSRFQGYVGITNFMGGRFTSTEAAVAPVLRELAKRGLIYVDDGASPRSLVSQIAGANNLPFAKASVVLDAVPSHAELDRALARLEAAAREAGSAVGVARALPLSIDRIAQWTKQAESRGIVVVPITAVAMKAKPS